ncbi:hypothetical protein [Methylobacterium fujisawaense]|uniref:Uncharacterized protein n=1 Tax=Methylobacterium fujisawaense TaxID=107400 RepID=A0ABR6D812_9HYPH|nr:hypothetical protein [Methylobacterium fujisawaense]MBA9061938.1 hypothetical protein [Methylobacterium fujisawaense]MDH3028067.1 hypothetical protein [Methylobacterium fujisawaense]
MLTGQHRGRWIRRIERSRLERGQAGRIQHQAGDEAVALRMCRIELVFLGNRQDAVRIDRHHALHDVQGCQIRQICTRIFDQASEIVRRRHEYDEMTGDTIDAQHAQVMPRLHSD